MAWEKRATVLERRITVAIASWLELKRGFSWLLATLFPRFFSWLSSHANNSFSVASFSGYNSHGFTTYLKWLSLPRFCHYVFVALKSHDFVFYKRGIG